MRKYFCFQIIAIFFFIDSAFSQVRKDSVSMNHLNSSAYKLFLQDPDSSIITALEALSRARNDGNAYREGECYFILSKANWVKGNYKLSLDYGLRASKIFESRKHPVELAMSQLSVARTFIDLKNYAKARSLIQKSTAIATGLGDDHLLAEAYREKSMLFSSLAQFDSAIVMADRGLQLFRSLNDTLNASILLSRKAKILFHKKQYRESLKLTFVAIAMDRLVKNNRALGISYLMAAENMYRIGKRDSAMWYASNAIPFSEKVSNFQTLMDAHDLIARIHLDHDNSTGAVEHLKLVNQFQDSVSNAKHDARLQEMQMVYDLETKDKTIADLENLNLYNKEQVASQRLLMSVLVGGIILLGALLLMFMKLRNIQAVANVELSAKNRAIEDQKVQIEAQAQNLERLNNLKTKLFSVISHDIRGPISTLYGLLELLTSRHMTQEEFVATLNKLKGNINVTQRTLENLLTWSLSQMDGLKTERTVVRVQDAIEESCRLMDEVASQKNVALIRDVSESHLVKADPDQLQLILRNLIQNAIKFSKQHGTVLITVMHHLHYCKITVKDFGIGMEQYEIDLILGAAEHYTKAGTQQEKGTGLGLMLCQEFVKRNEGTFAVQSVPGEGSEFSVSLVSAGFSNG